MRRILVLPLLLAGCSHSSRHEPSRFEFATATTEIQKARLVLGDCADSLSDLHAADAKDDGARHLAATHAAKVCSDAAVEANREGLAAACVGVAADGQDLAKTTRSNNRAPAQLTSYEDGLDRCYATVALTASPGTTSFGK